MKTMNALILFAFLLFPTVGFAKVYYTLPEVREQAAKGWHETYTDAFGRNIQVDIDVDVYGGELAPVLKVRIPVQTLDSAIIPENVEWQDGKTIELYKNHPANAVFQTRSGEQVLFVYRSYGERVDMNKRYMEEYGTKLTLRQMVDDLNDVMCEMGIEERQYVYDTPKEFDVICKVKKSNMEIVEPAIYYAFFWQEMHGLPILTHAAGAFVNGCRGPEYIPQLCLAMREDHEYSIMIHAVEEIEELEGDIPLVSFGEVKSAVEELIEKGHVRKVLSMKFGYVVYNDPNYPKEERSVYAAECYYLVPTWVVECIYVQNPRTEYVYKGKHSDELSENVRTTADYKMLLINAQNGMMFNMNDKSKYGKGDADYKEYVSWEAVQ